jgi:FKBP-type peptidyl-prolyl cis-trans isomerase
MGKMKQKAGVTILGLLGLILVLFTGCDPAKKWEREERQQLQSYLNSLGDTVYVKKTSGLYFIETLAGTGRTPIDKDTVFLRYKTNYLDGRLLQSNLDSEEPFSFILGSGTVILGLDEGVRYMKNGGKAILITPSPLAYGPSGWYPYIAGYTPFRWQIELVDVRAGTK